MDRRHFLRGGIGFLGALFLTAEFAPAAEPVSYDRMLTTLYPKTEGEKKYIKEVAALVRTKKLPEKIVYAAWRSAESKQKNKRIRYFAETLAILCKRAGVKLDIRLVP